MGMAMEPRQSGLVRLKEFTDAAGRKVADAAKSATQFAGDVASGAQEAAKHAADQAAALADSAGQKVAEATKAATQFAGEVAGGTQEAAKQAADQAVATAVGVTDAVSSFVLPKRKEAVDLSQLADDAKLLYCRVLVDLALVDGHLDPREISNLYLFASTIGLGAEARSALRREITGAQRRAADESGARDAALNVATELHDLVDADERGALITMLVRDLVRISRADRQVAETERERIVLVAGVGFPDSADKLVEAAEGLVATEEEFAAGKITTSQMEARTKDIVAQAAAFGAPIAAISLAGSVTGLGAAGITSGLAALGFGGILGLSAMVTGIGTVVILGVAVYSGVRFLLGTNERERENRRESLIQQVIRNHQQAMADLTDDIAALAGRMEAYLTQTTKNEDRLAALRAELAAFQQALVDLQISQRAFESGEPINAG